ncbi:MAG: DUF134 domain-containing protein [Asgard group archaeon]|nr:DUF134 domain-containing protein [Asgard group archaeon]
MSNRRHPPRDGSGFHRGKGRMRGHGRGRGRGRPVIAYPIEHDLGSREAQGSVELSSFELQILQMADIDGLIQNDIAEKLEISQTSVWRYLKAVRERIAIAIAENNSIRITIKD